ncbi:MAG: cation-binding protein [Porphyrobacter sp.]|nr:cation-binding protein [Porphyrobacter sp.]
MDIVDCILADHDRQRRLFAALDEARGDTEAAGAIFAHLREFLEAHAAAEERFFYPRLLECGKGALDSDSAAETTEDAIDDHNDIGAAADKAMAHEVGSDDWWKCVDEAHYQNSKHLSEEERQGLSDLRRHVPVEERVKLGVKYLAFESAHPAGYDRREKDPEDYVESGGKV